MNLNIKNISKTVAISTVLFFILQSCSVGSRDPSTENLVTGVAATGAPIFGTVTLKDSSTPAVERTNFTGGDGTFAFNTAGITAPFIIRTTSGGKTLYSIATGNGTTNINPLTTIAVSVAAGGADLNAMYATPTAQALNALVLKLPSAELSVKTALAPILSRFGVSGSIFNSVYVADHTGADALFDVVNVNLAGGTITLTNKSNGLVIFTAPASAISNGSVAVGNIPDVPVLSLGTKLYMSNCSVCHGDIYNSTLAGRGTAVAINGAIASDIGGMGSLDGLTMEEIRAISDAIPAQGPPPPPGASTGAVLYINNCAACHGPLATSNKLGATVPRIQNAISANLGNMARFSSLTAAEIQDIVVALNSTQPPPTPPNLDGAALYITHCAGCHGPLATSGKAGATASRIQTAITNNTGNMGFLSTLTADNITNIATALATVTPVVPTDGPGLYGYYCAACHNPLATSSKGGATATKISAAIASNRGAMASLSALTENQVTLIATALVPIAPPACGSCHGVILRNLGTGRHNTHATEPSGAEAAQFTAATSCGICHGAGYTTSSNGNLLTHNDGIKTITEITTTNALRNGLIHWVPPVRSTTGTVLTRGSCSPACHGKETW